MRSHVGALLVTLALLLAACATGEPQLEVIGEPAASAGQAGSSQVRVTIANRGDGDDTLLGASTDQAVAVEIHVTEIDGGRATMGVLEDFPIPAGEEVSFRPGQEHLMLVVPDETVVEGGTLELTLEFDRSEPLTLQVPVIDLVDLAEGRSAEDDA